MKRQVTELSNLRFALLMALPVMIFLVLVVGYPLGFALWMSVHKIIFFGGYRTSFVGFDNYVKVAASPDFWHSLWISVRFTVETVVLTMSIGLGLALALSARIPARALIRTLVILPWAFSLYGTAIVFSYVMRGHTGIGTALRHALTGSDTPLNFLRKDIIIEVLAIGSAWNMAPLVAFFLLANMSTIPRRLYDLADIDQMTRFQKFYHVTLPPLRFTLFVFTCIYIVLSLKLFEYIFVMTGGGPGTASATLTYQIYKISFLNLDLGYGAAMSFYLLAFIIGATLFLYFIWGRREAREA